MTASTTPPRAGAAREWVRQGTGLGGRRGRRWARVTHPPWAVMVAGGLLVVAMAGLVTLDWWRPLDTYRVDHDSVLVAPSWAYPMGTDNLGRDMFTWSLHGLRTSLTISVAAAVGATLLGGTVGLAAGALGGRVDSVLMRLVDVFASQSHFLFGLLILVLLRPAAGPAVAIMAAVALTHWVTIARLVRAEMLTLRHATFVTAAIGAGATRRQLVRLHFLPNLAPVISLAFVLTVPHAVFHETGYSFLGLGMPLESPSLGRVLGLGQANILAGGWWVAILPGLLLFVTAACIGILGERGRDHLDPQISSELQL